MENKGKTITIKFPDMWKTLTVALVVLSLFNSYTVANLNNRMKSVTGSVVEVGDSGQPSQIKEVGPQQPSQQAQQPSPQPTQQQQPSTDVSVDDDAVLGSADAPVTIIEFSDFECPFCTRFYEQTLPLVIENYVDTGKAKLIYRDFPLGFHANAQKAAEAAECAGEQSKYWEMHDAMFEGGELDTASLKKYAEDIGLDTASFNDCLDSGEMADEVQKDMQDGQAAGVSGTPTFFINGVKIVGAQPYSAFQQAIEQALAG